MQIKVSEKDLSVGLQQVPKDAGPPSLGKSAKAGHAKLFSPPALQYVHSSFLLFTHQGFFHSKKSKTRIPNSLSLMTSKWSPTLC